MARRQSRIYGLRNGVIIWHVIIINARLPRRLIVKRIDLPIGRNNRPIG